MSSQSKSPSAKRESSPHTPNPTMCTSPNRNLGGASASMAPSMMSMVHPGAAAAGVNECMCPTCQYYKAVYLYSQECHSPNYESYAMYPYAYPMMYPMPTANMQQQQQPTPMSAMPPPAMMMMPPHHMHQQQLDFTGGSMAREESVSPLTNSVVEQFQQCIGNIVKTACTPNGRSMLQSVMRLQHLDKIQTIFDEMIIECDAVMLDAHGCHVVRSLIDYLDAPQLENLVVCLTPNLILNLCTLSQYTRRILQTLFERHKLPSLQPIVDILSTNAQYLAATQQGCISLMRVFERCSAEQKAQLISQLLTHFSDLACDPFGNYVVQCCLENSEPHVASQYMVDCFSGHLLKMACNKFASNVLEKMSRLGSPQVRRILLDELIFNPAALQQISCDGFGNFVVQTLVETSCTATEFKKICDRLRPVIPQSPYGHKIDARIRAKRMPGANLPVNNHFTAKNRQSSPLATY